MCCSRACCLFLCKTKPVRNIKHYFVSKQFHECIIFFIVVVVNQLFIVWCCIYFHVMRASTRWVQTSLVQLIVSYFKAFE